VSNPACKSTTGIDLEEWTEQLFALFPNGIRGALLVDAAQERGFDREAMASLIRIGLDDGTFTLGDNMQFVRVTLS
jgi:hypothetical protein